MKKAAKAEKREEERSEARIENLLFFVSTFSELKLLNLISFGKKVFVFCFKIVHSRNRV